MKSVAKGIGMAFLFCADSVKDAWLLMRMTAVTITASMMTIVGQIMEKVSEFDISDSLSKYLSDKGSILSDTTAGLEEYLNSMKKVNSYEEDFDKQFTHTKSQDSGIGNKINFPTTSFTDGEKFSVSDSAKESNKLLQAKIQILNELQTPYDKYIERTLLINKLNQVNLLTQTESNKAFEYALALYEKQDGIITFKEALQSTIDSALELGGIMQNAIGSAIDGLATQITNFVLTGKANFLDLAGSIAKMVLEMTIKLLILKTLMSAFGMSSIAFSKGGVFSGGGNVSNI